MNRKGSILDLFWVMLTLFIVGILIFVGDLLKDEVMANIKTEIGTQAGAIMTTVEHGFNTLDYIFLFLTVGFGLATIVLAYLIPADPVWFFISLILVVILVTIAPTFSNAMRDFALSSEFDSIRGSYPIMSRIWQYFPHYMALLGLGTLIVMYSRMKSGGE